MTACDAVQEEAGGDDRLHGMTIRGEGECAMAGCNAALPVRPAHSVEGLEHTKSFEVVPFAWLLAM